MNSPKKGIICLKGGGKTIEPGSAKLAKMLLKKVGTREAIGPIPLALCIKILCT